MLYSSFYLVKHLQEKVMKTVKLVVAVLLVLSSTTALACQTKTYIVDGKITICTVCPNYVYCS